MSNLIHGQVVMDDLVALMAGADDTLLVYEGSGTDKDPGLVDVVLLLKTQEFRETLSAELSDVIIDELRKNGFGGQVDNVQALQFGMAVAGRTLAHLLKEESPV
jgi:hypothetical protein